MQAFAARLLRWQRRHGRHGLPWQRRRDPYRVWLSEIMLQQTRVDTVIPYFERFLQRFPDLQSLVRARPGEVLRLWSGLGYYARARNLHAAARQVARMHGGRLPDTVEALQRLPGIGRSTAGAIAALAFDRPAPMLDANARRVLERCFGLREERALWRLAESLVPAGSAAAYTQGLMDLGSTVCTPAAPACDRCPIAAECVTRRNGTLGQEISSGARRSLPVRNSRWLVLLHENRVLLERRPASGLWGGLWTFPQARGGSAKTDAARLGCSIRKSSRLPPFHHAFSHFRLRVEPVLCFVGEVDPGNKARDRRWFALRNAAKAAVPAPVRRLLEGMRSANRREQAGASRGTGAALRVDRRSRPFPAVPA